MTIRRYSCSGDNSGMFETEDGPYVLWDDYADELAEYADELYETHVQHEQFVEKLCEQLGITICGS